MQNTHKDGSAKGYLWSVLSGPAFGQIYMGSGTNDMEWTWITLLEMIISVTGRRTCQRIAVASPIFAISGEMMKEVYNPENQVTAPQIVAKVFTITGNRGGPSWMPWVK